MSETIDATSYNFPGVFVIEAITLAGAWPDKISSNPVEVKLTVNNVELPFTKVMEEIYRRMESQIDRQAKELAEKMVTEAGLDKIVEALRDAEWKVKEALDKVQR
jgi:hypothetical protein